MARMNWRIGAVLVCIVAWGCSGSPSNPIDFSEGDFPVPPTNIKISISDRVVSLSWNHPEEASVERFKIYRQDTTGQRFQNIGSTDRYLFDDTNLQNGRTYRYRISSVGINGLEGQRSEIVTAVPAIFGVLINSGQAFTNARNVSLSFAAPATTTLVMVANDSSFSNGQWENFSTPKNWVLTQGDGIKRVFVKFRNNRDVETAIPFTDTIILDTEARIQQFTHDALGRILTPADTIHLVLNAGEPGGVAQVDINNVQIGIRLFDNGTNGDAVAGDGIYEVDYVIPTGPEVEETLVIGRFVDRASNQASNLNSSSGRVTIRRPPTPVELIAVEPVIGSSRQLNLFWTRNSDADYANYRIFRATTPGVNSQSPLVNIIQNRNTLTYRDSLLAPNTVYYYKVFVFDVTGLSFGSNERSGRTNP